MGILADLKEILKGKKTYLIALSAIVAALLGYANDQLTIIQLVQAIFMAIGGMTLRAGMKNK